MLKEGRWLLAAAQQLESRMRQIATGFESELRLMHDSLIPTHAFNQDICAFEDLHCGTRLRISSEALTGTWEALREGAQTSSWPQAKAQRGVATRRWPWAAWPSLFA